MLELQKLLIKDIMITELHTAGENDHVSTVWEIMTLYNVRHVPIVDEDHILEGIVTLKDIYRTVPMRRTMEGFSFYDRNDLDRYILKYIMTTDVLALLPTDTMGAAIDIMIIKKYGCVPITDKNKKLLGIVTPLDVLRRVAPYFL